MITSLKYITLFFSVAFLLGCNGDDEVLCKDSTPDPILIDIRDQEIIPSYISMYDKLIALESSSVEFQSEPNQENLDDLRAQLKCSWLEWQNTSSFEFGPAEDNALRSNVNTFPADSFSIREKISNLEFNLISNDTKGFPALDLLINGIGSTDEEILSFHQEENSPYQEYKNAIIHDLISRVQNVKEEWEESYGELFVQNTGFATGSSFSLYINAYIGDWEQIKRDRIALPLGLLTFEIPLPDRVECYYGGYSRELASEHVLTHERKYLSEGYDGIQNLVQDITDYFGENGQSLDEAITEKFTEGKTKLELVDDPLSQTVLDDPDTVNEAYLALQGMVVLLKTDLTSGLGISINFDDTDGD